MEFTLKLTLDQVNTIIGALAKGSYESVADTLHLVRQQAQQQVAAAEQAAKPAE